MRPSPEAFRSPLGGIPPLWTRERLKLTRGPVDEFYAGVPEWFASDGCTASPDLSFVKDGCRMHDFRYWIGSPWSNLDNGYLKQLWKDRRKAADVEFYALMWHNSAYDMDTHRKVSAWRRWLRRRTVIVAYFKAVRWAPQAKRSFRKRVQEWRHYSPEQLEANAIAENKHTTGIPSSEEVAAASIVDPSQMGIFDLWYSEDNA